MIEKYTCITCKHNYKSGNEVPCVDCESKYDALPSKWESDKIVHKMTAQEYAEKLKAVLGNETAYSRMSIFPCRGRECRDCPFSEGRRKKEGYNGGCIALMLYRPDLAVKMMDEWQAYKDKPKGKTYQEDFFEKFPNADRTAAGLPMPCRNKLYFTAAPCSASPHFNCDECWNEAMPEDE